MKLLVLGATGKTGRAIVTDALSRGHQVTILARNPDRAAGLRPVRIIQGDARDPAAVARAVAGQDAVVSSLGTPVSPFCEVTLLSDATRILVHEMRRAGVACLVAITGMGAGDSAGHGGFFFDRVFKPAMLRKVYEDKDRQEALIHESGLDWTILRPSVLNDKSSRGTVRVLTDLRGFHGGTIARRDVAQILLDEVETPQLQGTMPLITW